MKLTDYKIIAKIVNKNFTWGMLDKRYDNITQLRCNVFCPMHPNYDTPSAKFYYDEDEDIWTLYCYSEKRRFTAYDFLVKVLIKERELYNSPIDFLRQYMSDGEIISQYKQLEKDISDILENDLDKKKEYIDNVYNETVSAVDYIETLYCPEEIP